MLTPTGQTYLDEIARHFPPAFVRFAQLTGGYLHTDVATVPGKGIEYSGILQAPRRSVTT
jgi:hypothetical protein